MNQFIVAFGTSFVSLVAFDALWIWCMAEYFYHPYLDHLFATPISFSWAPAVLFYLFYASGVTLFVVVPRLHNKSTLMSIFLYGAFYGLIVYGGYDLISQALLKNWPATVTVVDFVWGSFMTGTVSLLAFLASRHA